MMGMQLIWPLSKIKSAAHIHLSGWDNLLFIVESCVRLEEGHVLIRRVTGCVDNRGVISELNTILLIFKIEIKRMIKQCGLEGCRITVTWGCAKCRVV